MNVLLMTSHVVIGAYDAPPIGLYRLKHHLNKQGYNCDILDTCLTGFDEALNKAKNGEYQIIGMSVSHNQMADDLSIIRKFRKVSKNNEKCLFIAGGQEATYNYEQWLKGGIDVIFLGYAERSLGELAKYFDINYDYGIKMLKEISGIAWHDGNHIRINPCRPMTQSEFDYLTYEQVMEMEVPYETYWVKARRETQGLNLSKSIFIPETVRMFTSSHCPNRCGYCSAHSFLTFSQQKKAPIFRISAEQIYNMVAQHIDKYCAKGFLFSDDEFLIDKKRATKFCDYIIKAKEDGTIDHNIMFNCQARVADFLVGGKNYRRVDHAFIDKLIRAGFHSIGMGIETFSDRLLSYPSMNKFGYTSKLSLQVVESMLEKGMIPHIFIILFIPETTQEEIIHTMTTSIDLIKNGCEIVVNPILRALPGAPIYGNPDYPMEIQNIKNPITNEVIEITKHFIPKDRKIADCASRYMDVADGEIDTFEKSGIWRYIKIPKTIAGMLMFIATAKLLGRYDLADEWMGDIHVLVRNIEERPQ